MFHWHAISIDLSDQGPLYRGSRPSRGGHPFEMTQFIEPIAGFALARAPFFFCSMAASNQQIADNARDSLNRILQTDVSEWSEGQRRARQLEIDRLQDIITNFELKAARSSGRRIFSPVRRVNL